MFYIFFHNIKLLRAYSKEIWKPDESLVFSIKKTPLFFSVLEWFKKKFFFSKWWFHNFENYYQFFFLLKKNMFKKISRIFWKKLLFHFDKNFVLHKIKLLIIILEQRAIVPLKIENNRLAKLLFKLITL